jgi:phosphatidylglycerol lysyltransferase
MNCTANALSREDFTRWSQRQQALRLLRRYGWNATSFQILQDHFKYWFSGHRACIAYVDTGRAWVVAGSPVTDADYLDTVAREFASYAQQHHRRVVFFGTESRFARSVEFKSIVVGSQTTFDARDWPSLVNSRPSLREQLRRARTKGVMVERLFPGQMARSWNLLRLDIDALIARWLAEKRLPPLGFLAAIQPFSFMQERRYFVARQAEAIVGFGAMVPVYERQGWLLENLVRAPEAPNGTVETLIDSAMREAAKTESGFLTLGLAPLAGDVGFWLTLAKRLGTSLYNFAGIERFRAKFQPNDCCPIYISFPHDQSAPLAIYDTLVAFAQAGLVRFGVRVLLRQLRLGRGKQQT